MEDKNSKPENETEQFENRATRKKSKLEQIIHRRTASACIEFDLIRPGDRILVAFSGGKDSYALLWMFRDMQQVVPFDFEFKAIHIDPGFPQEGRDDALAFLAAEGFECELVEDNFGRIIKEVLTEKDSPCALCARMRYGIIFRRAKEMGIRKIALGHHMDDAVETLLMNMFFSGQIKGMPFSLLADKENHLLIRPMLRVEEKLLVEFAEEKKFPIIKSRCPLLERKREWRRKWTKEKVDEMSASVPQIRHCILAAMSNVRAEHLHDRELYDFEH